MKKTVIPILAALVGLALAAPAPAQFYPDPVDLGIDNEQQEIEEWFWPALTRQILLKHGPQPPTQCQIMSLTLTGDDGNPGPDCCLSQTQDQAQDLDLVQDQDQDQAQDQARSQDQNPCKRPIDHTAVIKIIEQFGLKAETVPRPTSPDQIYEYMQNGRALLVGFLIAKDKKHAYLVRGISWTDEGQPLLKINDPHVTEPFLAPFAEEYPGWQTVIAVDLQ